MTDINLLHDRGFGDERKDQEEKEKEKSRIVVELTNPSKETHVETTEKPGSGFWSFLKELFTGRRQKAEEKPGTVRILHEQREKPEPAQEPPQKKKRMEEHYAPNAQNESGLEDVFAPPLAPQQPSAQPRERERPASPPRIPSPNLQGGSFSGTVNLPPQPAATPPKTAPQGQQSATPPQGAPQEKKQEPSPEDASTFLGVNLVPEEMMSSVSRQNRAIALAFIAAMSMLVVGLAYIGLSIYNSRIVMETEAQKQEMAIVDRQIQKLTVQKRDAEQFHSVTEQALSLLDTHIYWTKFFSGLEKYTLQTVSVRSASADQSGHLTLTLSGKDYRSLAQQLLAFEAATDFVKSVSITAGESAQGKEGEGQGVNFSATITLMPNVFYRDSTGGPTYTLNE
ncbi:MAG: hypothetical protein V1778_04180 [bacterium]